MARAVSNIVPRSERQPDLNQLKNTYVETGVLPQVDNYSNQILYERRGTGKTHVLKVLGDEIDRRPGCHLVYLDVRLLGSAHLFQDESRHPAERCIAVFKDFLSILQSELLDLATDPEHNGSGVEEVSEFAEFLMRKTADVSKLEVRTVESADENATTAVGISLSSNGPGVGLNASRQDSSSTLNETAYTEALRETIVFGQAFSMLDRALDALSVQHLVLLVDEWTSLPVDMQPFVAEFLKRVFFANNRVTIKIGSLEYRSKFTLGNGYGNPVGFELGPDITANLDLDDYYVYDRNPAHVIKIFHEVLYKHVRSGLPEGCLESYNVRDKDSLRTRLFTEHATFVELVRAGEGVARDFLGIFASAFFKARNSGRIKIDLNSVEEAARDWYETDKSTVLSSAQREALQRIITDVIGNRQTKMFMLRREDADHPMIQSLFDLRLLHLISRGYSDKENPGQRYNIYALDYGTYVDLKRTKSQPEELTLFDELFEVSDFEVEPSEGRIVPFADRSSIRRVILQTSIFD